MSVEKEFGGFSARLAAYLQKTDYRLATTEVEKLELYKLRYKSYVAGDAIDPNPLRQFRDFYDEMDNCWTFGVYVDGVLASSIRFHVLSAETPYGPACDFFPDIVKPWLDQGLVLIDPTRLVTDPDIRKLYPEIPYVTVRMPAMAYEHFNADYSLASVRKEHQAFYRKLFAAEALCEPRPYPPLTVRLSLMKLRLDQSREKLLRRYPIFSSSLTERRLMFEKPGVASVLNEPRSDSNERFPARLVS